MHPCMCRDWSENRDSAAPLYCATVGSSSNSFHREMGPLLPKVLSENVFEPKKKVLEARDVSVQVSFYEEKKRSNTSEVTGKSDFRLEEEKPLPSSSFFTTNFPEEKRIQTLPSRQLSRIIPSCVNSGNSSRTNSISVYSPEKSSMSHYHRGGKSSSTPFPRASSSPLHISPNHPASISNSRFEAPATSARSFNHSSGVPTFPRRNLSVPHFFQTARIPPYGLQSGDSAGKRTPLSNSGPNSRYSNSLANTRCSLTPPPRGVVRSITSRYPTEAPPLSSTQYSSPSSVVIQRAPSTRRTAMRRSPSVTAERSVLAAHCSKPAPLQIKQVGSTASPHLSTTSRSLSRRSSSRRLSLRKEVLIDSEAILVRNVASSPMLSVWSTTLNSGTAAGRICRLNVLPILAAREAQKQADVSYPISTSGVPPQHVEWKKVEDNDAKKSKEKEEGKEKIASEPRRASRKARKPKKARTIEKKKKKVEKRKRIRISRWQKWVKWSKEWWWKLFSSSSSHSSSTAKNHRLTRSTSQHSRCRDHFKGSTKNGTLRADTLPQNKKVANHKWKAEAPLKASERSDYTRSDYQKKRALPKSFQSSDAPWDFFFQKVFRMRGIVCTLLFLIFLTFFPLMYYVFFSSASTSSTVNTRIFTPPSYFSSSSIPIPPSFV